MERDMVFRVRKAILARYGNQAWCVKFHASQFTPPGIPDLLGVVKGRMFALEVKQPKGRIAPAQEKTLRRIRRAGGVARVVYSAQDALDVLDF